MGSTSVTGDFEGKVKTNIFTEKVVWHTPLLPPEDKSEKIRRVRRQDRYKYKDMVIWITDWYYVSGALKDDLEIAVEYYYSINPNPKINYVEAPLIEYDECP
jgi:hypothetical protein